MSQSHWARKSQSTAQRGAALLFSLIFLLLLTIIGLTAMQSATMQERMAGNVRDANLAFQAAEVGLRDAEKALDAVNIPAFDTTGPYRSYTANIPDATAASTWNSYTWSDANSHKVTATLTGIDATNNPRYVIEEMYQIAARASSGGAVDLQSIQGADDSLVYRVTSRGVGSTGKSVVLLQSTFRIR